jgi:hypothetical protein
VKAITREFLVLSLGVIALFVLLTHSTGAARTLGALGNSGAVVFRTLQGR